MSARGSSANVRCGSGAAWAPGAVSLVGMQFDHVAQQVPDIAAAIEWWSRLVPGARVLYADETWGLLEAGGAKIAFVMADQHPSHLAFRVSNEELSRLADSHGVEVSGHRDGSRSFYLQAPGEQGVEVIAYRDAVDEDVE
jgi:catechol 2,3-dioxygenase-like lactoylglutathione lyase family enzyme